MVLEQFGFLAMRINYLKKYTRAEMDVQSKEIPHVWYYYAWNCQDFFEGLMMKSTVNLMLSRYCTKKIMSTSKKYCSTVQYISGAPRAFQQSVYKKCMVLWLRVLAKLWLAVHNDFCLRH